MLPALWFGGFADDSGCLDRGYNIGIRLIDEFLAKSKTGKCIDFRDTADKIAKVHFVLKFRSSTKYLM